jgi:hypothetical protein
MWYFQFNNQQNGPNDSEVIKILLVKQTLTRDTLVWKEGMNDWRRLADTELASLIPATSPPPINPSIVQPPPIEKMAMQPPPISQIASQSDQPADPLTEFLNTPKGIRSLWLWSVILLGVGVGLFIYGILIAENQRGDEYPQEFSVAQVIGGLIAIGGAVLWWILLFKSWAAIQDGKPSTTPGKAVGFMFIPLFNYYWQFVAILGLARQLNYYCKERSIAAKPVDEQLTLAYCILFCTLWIPYLNILTGIAFAFHFFILWKSIAETVALIITAKHPSTSPS